MWWSEAWEPLGDLAERNPSRRKKEKKAGTCQIFCVNQTRFFLAFFQPILATCNSLPDNELAQRKKEFRKGKMNHHFYLHKIQDRP
jgi:hypothetical protein